ncbi:MULTISPECIES: MobC family plasmid mobilization relaxosome protein [Bacillati]|uniref:MobC family plasmid mobilization relaxosome protein n=1 Tax=Bacillati TaxID=1783272 RepID=UPI0035DF2F1D
MSNLKEVKFRLTAEEVDKAKKISNEYSMSINAIAKFLLLNLKAPKGANERKDVKELNRQIGAIGNNLNQMARRLNSTSMLRNDEKKEVISLLKEIRNNTRILVGKEPIEESKEDIIFKHKSHFH